MIEFSIVPQNRGREAYQWHRGFAAQNAFILPRSWGEYRTFAEANQVWCARDESGDFLGLAYFSFDAAIWELGGLMVAARQRRNGVGSTLVRLMLAHLLCSEDPLSRDEIVVARVHADNMDVIAMAQRVLGFRHHASIRKEWPGDPPVMVTGHEFRLVNPQTVELLAGWCDEFELRMQNSGFQVRFAQKRESLGLWAAALREMAGR